MMIVAAMAGMAALQAYSSYQANQAADSRAEAANANNAAAAEQSRLLAERDARLRQEELLRRFDVRAGKVKDSVNDVKQATAVNITNLDMEILKAKSVTDNTTASRHIEGRLAERLQSVVDIKGDLQKGTMVQGAEQNVRTISEKLEAMRMDLESEQLNINIDLSNAINQANNNEIRNVSYSSSTGTLGVITSGLVGVSQGASLYTSYTNYQSAKSNYNTQQQIGDI